MRLAEIQNQEFQNSETDSLKSTDSINARPRKSLSWYKSNLGQNPTAKRHKIVLNKDFQGKHTTIKQTHLEETKQSKIPALCNASSGGQALSKKRQIVHELATN